MRFYIIKTLVPPVGKSNLPLVPQNYRKSEKFPLPSSPIFCLDLLLSLHLTKYCTPLPQWQLCFVSKKNSLILYIERCLKIGIQYENEFDILQRDKKHQLLRFNGSPSECLSVRLCPSTDLNVSSASFA